MLDYHVHAAAHGEYEYSLEWLGFYLDRARQLGIDEIGFSEHDEYLSRVDYAVLDEVQRKFPDIRIRTGLEVDYKPGREDEIRIMLDGRPLDYIIGSVHFIGDWGFDHPDYRHAFADKDIDQVYHDYFALLEQAVDSGLFHIMAHLDLVKIWGHRPARKTVMSYALPVLKRIRKAGMAVEINSAGLRKPVGEIYPAREIVAAMYEMGIPVTLGSDAHHPDQLGEGLTAAYGLAWQAGYRQVASFQRGRRTMRLLESGR